MMGAFAEFERSLIKERQREGIELGQKKGVYKGRRKALSSDEITALNERVNSGVNKSALAKELGISRQTLYEYLRSSS
jgi:DNA invertase Pin-like site-specific DNA recombinase